MITKEELDQIRPLVESSPEGSPARILLSALDEILETKKAASRQAALDACFRRGHTPEEAEKIVASMEAGKPCETEEVRCWNCDGWGHVQLPGCIGSQSGDCPICHGRGRAWRFKIPA